MHGRVDIAGLMQQSGVVFGTSGARGLVADMSDAVCYAYTAAFLQYLAQRGEIRPGMEVAIAGDLRASTPRIMAAAAAAIADLGYRIVNCGHLPSPAVAFFGMQRGIPSLMVTGSHIPDDRNGIKFNRSNGEILKADEIGIKAQRIDLPAGRFDTAGMLLDSSLPEPERGAYLLYVKRYLDFFDKSALRGLRIAVYQHSGVARDLLVEILIALGAEVIELGRSERFVPVDTEAIRPEDIELARQWVSEHAVDAIVSTDGDADRPLIADEQGQWLRGDVVGVLCAHYLLAQSIATPVSSNTVAEKCGWFEHVRRTRIGSPYVIEAMMAATNNGEAPVIGYEANGGLLLGSAVNVNGRMLAALPTRDALIVILSVLAMAKARDAKLSTLLHDLPPRYTYSDRIKNFPTEVSKARLAMLSGGRLDENKKAIEALFGRMLGVVKTVDTTDGLRITFESDEVVHFRPSGNAPELRCYSEADTSERAQFINRQCMAVLGGWKN